jgi:hypothetical protein
MTFTAYGRRDGLRNASSIGHGVLIVVDGVTPIQGDGNTVHRAKEDR